MPSDPRRRQQPAETIFPWPVIVAFFAALVLVAWFLFPDAYFRGLIYSRDADPRASVEYFNAFLRRNPYHRGATIALMKVFEDAGDPESAVKVMTELYLHRKGDETVGQDLLGLLDRAGKLAEAQRFRWQLYEDLRGRPEVRRATLESLLYAFYSQAELGQDLPQEAGALSQLTQTAAHPESFQDALVRLYLVEGKGREALALAESRLRGEPKALPAWLAVADARMALGEAPAALATLQQGLDQLPDQADLLARRVYVLESLGRYAEAAADLRRLAALKPEDDAVRKSLAYDTLRGGAFAQAAALYREEVKRSPDDPRAWKDLISIHAERHMSSEAAAVLKDYLARFPDDREAWRERVSLYSDRRMDAEAAAVLKDYLARFPDDPQGYEQLAFLSGRQGRPEEALAPLRGYVRRHPEDDKLTRILADLLLRTSRRRRR